MRTLRMRKGLIMRFVVYKTEFGRGVGLQTSQGLRGILDSDHVFPGTLDEIIRKGTAGFSDAAIALEKAPVVPDGSYQFEPPFSAAGKIICVGLNYRDHSAESNIEQPDYPTLFARFNTSLVGHMAPIVRPVASTALDYEGEVVAIIGKSGRHISKLDALDFIAGYSIFNDATLRDFQHRTPQWTVGKNFDGTGAFGPEFVTAEEVPKGARGLDITTRLNGRVVQSSNTNNLVFDIATLISTISQAMTLECGDIIITGTPAGVGHARVPKLYMKPGDTVEVEVSGLGVLSNVIIDEKT